MAVQTGRMIGTLAFLFLAGETAVAHSRTDRPTSAGDGAFASAQAPQFRPVRTDSPRQTFETFLYLAGELHQLAAAAGLESASDDRESYERTLLLTDQAAALIDLSGLPAGSRREMGWATVAYLLDIVGRIQIPAIESIPDAEEADEHTLWRVPETPLRIVRVSEGPRQGEYLFAAETQRDAGRFYRGIRDLPLRSDPGFESWTQALPQITGPMIPARMVRAIPQPLKRLWLGTPIWKIFIVSVLLVGLWALVVLLHRLLSRHKAASPAGEMTRRAVVPLAILLVVWWVRPLVAYELNVAGTFWAAVTNVMIVVRYTAAAWLSWYVTQAVFERIVQARTADREAVNNQLILIGGKTVAILGVVVIAAAGAQALGVPVYSIVAGLGVGGIAVALAIRPTLENLLGGVILYLDHPVRVGDFCSFGDKMGTVERIGMRTIKIRGRDRTLITIPNAVFADMQLVNWAECDMMLITTTVRLRYETDSDQLRHILVRIREMFHAHPKIDRETVRIRLSDFGPSSIDINMRVYALTRDWNEFFAIREDVLLRVKDIVAASGAGFALPSQTLHMTRDRGMDSARGDAAAREVEAWRQSGQLPFPRLSAARMAELDGTLDWPPRGSIDGDLAEPVSAEPLSAEGAETGGSQI